MLGLKAVKGFTVFSDRRFDRPRAELFRLQQLVFDQKAVRQAPFHRIAERPAVIGDRTDLRWRKAVVRVTECDIGDIWIVR